MVFVFVWRRRRCQLPSPWLCAAPWHQQGVVVEEGRGGEGGVTTRKGEQTARLLLMLLQKGHASPLAISPTPTPRRHITQSESWSN